MSNQTNDAVLERLYEQVIEDDNKGLIADDVSNIARQYGLHEDDDRDEILQFIAESLFYNNHD